MLLDMPELTRTEAVHWGRWWLSLEVVLVGGAERQWEGNGWEPGGAIMEVVGMSDGELVERLMVVLEMMNVSEGRDVGVSEGWGLAEVDRVVGVDVHDGICPMGGLGGGGRLGHQRGR